VEGQQYTIHRLFLFRDSPVLREMFTGLSDALPDHPYTLTGVTKDEFEHLLWVYYNPQIEYYRAPMATWRDILKLAEMWRMTQIQHLAINHLLSATPLGPIERIMLCERDGRHRSEANAAYLEVCARQEPLTTGEFQALSMDVVLLIMQMREKILINRREPDNELRDEDIVKRTIGLPPG
ncbi:hypothetical protein DFH07DRAFT_721462, partial [Mycena maculata]